MEAALKGHKEVVQLLLAAGADVNARDRYDCTAKMRKHLKMGEFRTVELLESYAKKKSG